MRIVLLICLICSGLTTIAQIKYSANGISFSLPGGFKTATPRGSEFATFNRNSTLQIAFANACHDLSGKNKSNTNNVMASDLCFEIQFEKMKASYSPTSRILNPKDTVIKKLNCKWAELHSSVKGQDYYLVYLLVKGKKYRYEVLFSGYLENKSEDLKILKEIMYSYKEQ
jgi:hypothetical protein